jgi:osmotically-inducible protein OsmY
MNGRGTGRNTDDGRPGWRERDAYLRRADDRRDDERIERDRAHREPDEREFLHRRSDHFGQGHTGYLSGRYGEDRAHESRDVSGYRDSDSAHYVDSRIGSLRPGSGPHRGKGPKNFMRSDERLRELACEALTDDSEIDASDIEVDAKNGEVTLKGVVEDRRMKRLAEDCVARIPGVVDVQNLLRMAGNKWQVESRGNQAASGAVSTSDPDKKHRA